MMSTSAAKPRMLTQREVTRQMKAKQAAEDAAAARAPAGNRYAASRAAAIAVAEKKAAAEAQAKKAATEKAVASIIKKVASTVCQAVVKKAADAKLAEEQVAEAKAARERKIAATFEPKPKLLGAWATLDKLNRDKFEATVKPGESKVLDLVRALRMRGVVLRASYRSGARCTVPLLFCMQERAKMAATKAEVKKAAEELEAREESEKQSPQACRRSFGFDLIVLCARGVCL